MMNEFMSVIRPMGIRPRREAGNKMLFIARAR